MSLERPLMKGEISVITLDMGLLVAGTKYRGEFEERLKKLMEEIKQSDEIILSIDEVHTYWIWSCRGGYICRQHSQPSEPARGELQCIGATTLDEYRKHIEKDPALERRFQPVKVPEPSVDETIQILQGLRERCEIHHKLRYTDDSLVAAAKLSYQYIRCTSLVRFRLQKTFQQDIGSHNGIMPGFCDKSMCNATRALKHYFVKGNNTGPVVPRPSLLKIPSFVVEFVTPLMKATNKRNNQVIAFFSSHEYDAWVESLHGN